jgi:hypothetical protein
LRSFSSSICFASDCADDKKSPRTCQFALEDIEPISREILVKLIDGEKGVLGDHNRRSFKHFIANLRNIELPQTDTGVVEGDEDLNLSNCVLGLRQRLRCGVSALNENGFIPSPFYQLGTKDFQGFDIDAIESILRNTHLRISNEDSLAKCIVDLVEPYFELFGDVLFEFVDNQLSNPDQEGSTERPFVSLCFVSLNFEWFICVGLVPR